MNSASLHQLAQLLLASHQLEDDSYEDLATAFSRGVYTSWNDAAYLCTEGDNSRTMFILIQGQVRVMHNDVFGASRELAILQAPTLLGHMGLLDGSRRSATCVAIGEVSAICISESVFQLILSEDTSASSLFRKLMMANMVQQLSQSNLKVRELSEDVDKLDRANLDLSELIEQVIKDAEKEIDSAP